MCFVAVFWGSYGVFILRASVLGCLGYTVVVSINVLVYSRDISFGFTLALM